MNTSDKEKLIRLIKKEEEERIERAFRKLRETVKEHKSQDDEADTEGEEEWMILVNG